MAYLAVDKDGEECLYNCKPYRECDTWYESEYIALPKGSIEKLVGRKLTWDDEPVELEDEAPYTAIAVPTLAEEDIAMLKYLWEEKEDIERYANFTGMLPLLRKGAPDLLLAWEKYKQSKIDVGAILRDM